MNQPDPRAAFWRMRIYILTRLVQLEPHEPNHRQMLEHALAASESEEPL